MSESELQRLNNLVTRLETLAETEAVRCPYRETISKAANNVQKIADMEKEVRSLHRDMLKIAVVAAVSAAGGGGIINAIGKALGWL